jgi:hypothetical protein
MGRIDAPGAKQAAGPTISAGPIGRVLQSRLSPTCGALSELHHDRGSPIFDPGPARECVPVSCLDARTASHV